MKTSVFVGYVLAVLSFALCLRAGAETGAQCYMRANCGNLGGIRRCYQCCTDNCTDSGGCQNKCDRTSKEMFDVVSGITFSDMSAVNALFVSDAYREILTRTDEQVLEWLYLNGPESVGRLSLAVAGDMLKSAKMDGETRGLAVSFITEVAASDNRPTVRISAINVYWDLQTSDVTEFLVDRITLDDDIDVRAHCLSLLLGEVPGALKD